MVMCTVLEHSSKPNNSCTTHITNTSDYELNHGYKDIVEYDCMT